MKLLQLKDGKAPALYLSSCKNNEHCAVQNPYHHVIIHVLNCTPVFCFFFFGSSGATYAISLSVFLFSERRFYEARNMEKKYSFVLTFHVQNPKTYYSNSSFHYHQSIGVSISCFLPAVMV